MRASTGELIDAYRAAENSGGGRSIPKPATTPAPAEPVPSDSVVSESPEVDSASDSAPAYDAPTDSDDTDRPMRLRDLVNQGKA